MPKLRLPHPDLLPVILRDAYPLQKDRRNQDGNFDSQVSQDVDRRCAKARDILFTIYRDAVRHHAVHQLPFELRQFIKEQRLANGGKMPRARGGRPTDQHHAILIALAVDHQLEMIGRARGNAKRVYPTVARQFHVRERTVQDIHRDQSREFRRLVQLSKLL